jgi:hypothetical protein
MPRNVVTVVPRFVPLMRSRQREQRRILDAIATRHRPTPRAGESVVLDFSKQDDPVEVRARVVAWLDEINPDWARYVRVYPHEGQSS